MTAISIHRESRVAAPEAHCADAGFVKIYLFSTDHKTIGIQFLFLGLIFFVVGGLLAMLIRWQLAFPNDPAHPVPILGRLMHWDHGNMPAEFYNIVLTMHATVMIFFVLIPILVGTFGNYLIPLKIGAGDMAFPFLNGLAFWLAVPSGSILVAGFFLVGGAAAAGWTSYPPLSAIAVANPSWPLAPLVMTTAAFVLFYAYIGSHAIRLGTPAASEAAAVLVAIPLAIFTVRCVQHVAFDGQACWFLSLFMLGFSSMMGAVNYLTTVVKLRCPGMTMFRLPLSVWSLFITAIIVLLATPVLAADAAAEPARPPPPDQLLRARQVERVERAAVQQPAAATRCSTSTCSGSTATRPSTS